MIIVTLIPLLIFFAILYLRFNKGKIAEKMVHHKLMQLPEEYHVIDNVLFMSNGRSTQIDHIVVSPYAVFVIETKGYKGWILGGESIEYWTQSIYGHKRKELCVNTSTTQEASNMTSEIRFNMVYAQDAEVCLLNAVANMGVSMVVQTIPNVHSL